MDYNNDTTNTKNINDLIDVLFEKENEKFILDIKDINFSQIIESIVKDNLDVSDENLKLTFQGENKDFDISRLKSLIIEIHDEYSTDINSFHSLISTEINTIISDEDLELRVLNYIYDKNPTLKPTVKE